jgi:glycosyltransferase involved in cell wall biosynthesis
MQPRIAVLLPCYNEEAAIAATVAGFKKALPGATVYVYDNNSRDRTGQVAAKAGAVVRTERQQGKGNVVRRMFADVDADIYLMADGDLTYDPKAAPAMVDLLLAEQLDMIVGTRKHEEKDAYRGGHVLGNRLFTGILSGLFGRSFTDIFSGYRVFSRRFVKSFPVLSAGFEIETEISVHALELPGRLANPEDDSRPVSRRKANALLRNDRSLPAGAGPRPRHPAGHHLPQHRPRSALPNRDPRHGNDRDCSALLLHRVDSRHRYEGPPRGPEACLPVVSRPGR